MQPAMLDAMNIVRHAAEQQVIIAYHVKKDFLSLGHHVPLLMLDGPSGCMVKDQVGELKLIMGLIKDVAPLSPYLAIEISRLINGSG